MGQSTEQGLLNSVILLISYDTDSCCYVLGNRTSAERQTTSGRWENETRKWHCSTPKTNQTGI